MNRRIGIVAALRGEVGPLVASWRSIAPGVYQYSSGETKLLAIAGGMGRNRATRAVAALSALGGLDALVSIGWAGALSCGAQPGVAYAVNEVIDAQTGERYVGGAPAAAHPLRLVSSDRIALGEEKRRLAERYQASLVDMEAATVARLAATRSIPFFCWKAVSDTLSEKLPDFNRFLGVDEQLQLPRLLMHVAPRPRYWPALARMGRNGRAGALALRTAIMEELL